MNYIYLINQFWQVDKVFHFKGSETRLYFALLNSCNHLAWKNPFRESDRYLSRTLKMSANTIRGARNRLIESGLITIQIPEKKSKNINGQSIYQLLTVSISDTVGGKKEKKSYQKLIQGVSETESPTVSKTDTNIKQSDIKQSIYISEEEKKNFYIKVVDFINSHLNKFQDHLASNPRWGEINYGDYCTLLETYSPIEMETTLYNLFMLGYYDKNSINHSLFDAIKEGMSLARREVQKKFNSMMFDCEGLKKMKKPLTTVEMFQLLSVWEVRDLEMAIQEVEDKPAYRTGLSAMRAIETNLNKRGVNRKDFGKRKRIR